MQATEKVIAEQKKHTKRALFACKLPAGRDFKVVWEGRPETESLGNEGFGWWA